MSTPPLSRIAIALFGTLFLTSCAPKKPAPDQSENKIEEPRDTTLIGEYICLPHRGVKPGQPITQECALGLLSSDSQYYALDMSASSQPMINLMPGDIIRVSGSLTDITKADSQFYRYAADKRLAVTSGLERVFYIKDSVQYSSEKAAREISVTSPKPNEKISLPLKVSGQVMESWLSQGQWGPAGTMRLMLEDENGMQVGAESVVYEEPQGQERQGFSGEIKLAEHTQSPTGYIVIYQSNFSRHREFVRIPVKF
jgi:hypothetical protein